MHVLFSMWYSEINAPKLIKAKLTFLLPHVVAN